MKLEYRDCGCGKRHILSGGYGYADPWTSEGDVWWLKDCLIRKLKREVRELRKKAKTPTLSRS